MAATETKRLVKLSVFLNKRPDLTDEEFHKHWSENHGPLIQNLPYFQQHLYKYNQFHNSMELRQMAAAMGLPQLGFDAAAEFWVNEVEDFWNVTQDPDYIKTIIPDENKFLSKEGIKIMIGYDELKMDRTSGVEKVAC